MVYRSFSLVGFAALLVVATALPSTAQEKKGAPPTAGASAAAAAAGDVVPLDISLPEAKFDGTPKDAKSDHLDPTTGSKRAPFMVPRSLANLAKDKKVTGRDSEPVIGDLEMVVDGDKEGAEGSFIEFGTGPQWVQIDLDKPAEIFAIVVWHFHSQARIYHDLIVQVSDDPSFSKEVKTVYNNDIDNSSKCGVGRDYEYIETNEGRLVDAKGVKGRYVRCYSNGNSSNDLSHMIEVEVWGRPAK